METLTTSKDCDQQLQTSFPTARRAQVPRAILVTFADMSHFGEIQWGDFANTGPNIPAVSPCWGPKISAESPASVSVGSILDMGIPEEILKSIDVSFGQPLVPLPSEPISDDSDVDMLDVDNDDNCTKTLSMHDAKVNEAESIAGDDIRDRNLHVPAKRSVGGLRLMSAIGLGFNPLKYESLGRIKRLLNRQISEPMNMRIERMLARFYCRSPRANVSVGSSGLDPRFGARSSRNQLSHIYGTDSVHIFDTITSRNLHRVWLAYTHFLIRHVVKGAGNSSENTSMPGSYVVEDGGETREIFRDPKLDLPSINSHNRDKADSKPSYHCRSEEDSAEGSADTSRPAVQQGRESTFLDYKILHKFDVYDSTPEEFLGFIRQTESVTFRVVNGEPFVHSNTRSWVRCSNLWYKVGDAYGASLLTKNSPRIDNIASGTNHIENYQVERVALFMTEHAPESVSNFILVAHTYGYHAHTKQIDELSAGYILGWAVESWSQGWPFVVVLDATSIPECVVEDLIRYLRVLCDTETMDVVIYADKFSEAMLNAGANAVLKCSERESLAFFFQKLQDRVCAIFCIYLFVFM